MDTGPDLPFHNDRFFLLRGQICQQDIKILLSMFVLVPLRIPSSALEPREESYLRHREMVSKLIILSFTYRIVGRLPAILLNIIILYKYTVLYLVSIRPPVSASMTYY